MKANKLLQKLIQSRNNVSFDDFVHCIELVGFKLKRVSGSHHVFSKEGIPDLVNVQCINGKAKPYQISQFLRILKLYDMKVVKENE